MKALIAMAGLLLLCSLGGETILAKGSQECVPGLGDCATNVEQVSYKACAFAAPFIVNGEVRSQSIAVVRVSADTSVLDCISIGLEFSEPVLGFRPVCLFPQKAIEASVTVDGALESQLALISQAGQQTAKGVWWPLAPAFPVASAVPIENCGW